MAGKPEALAQLQAYKREKFIKNRFFNRIFFQSSGSGGGMGFGVVGGGCGGYFLWVDGFETEAQHSLFLTVFIF